jgi:amino acid adenylation domain-containing protein
VLNGGSLQSIFRDRAEESPDSLAVIDGEEKCTYRELDRKSDCIAAELRRYGVRREALVGVMMDTSIDLIAAILGITKADGVYVPIDPTYPAERQRLLVQNSKTGLIIGHARYLVNINSGSTSTLDIQQALDSSEHFSVTEASKPRGSQAAYVIFTSGTEGGPKGVVVEHRNVIDLFRATKEIFAFSAKDRWTMFHSSSFDFSVWEMWGPLLSGATLVLVPSDLKKRPREFLNFIHRQSITILSQTPSMFRILSGSVTDQTTLSSLRLVVLGGEALYPKHLRRWFEQFGFESPTVVNMYGITECTVHATFRRICLEDLQQAASPIGTPLPGVKIRLLDSQGNAVPSGEPGEIHISGWGLARGYLDQPVLTADRFRHLENSERIYKSGDIATELATGEFLYQGRNDGQIKSRGYRIELSEIEECVERHPDVNRASALKVIIDDDDHRLVAFVVPNLLAFQDEESLRIRLKHFVESNLPGHMCPEAYYFSQSLPVTPNGKLDTKTLEANVRADLTGSSEGTADWKNDLERKIAPLWSDLTKCKQIDRVADFFDVGGSSLSALRLITQLEIRFGVPIDLNELEGDLSISSLAVHIQAKLSTAKVTIPEYR